MDPYDRLRYIGYCWAKLPPEGEDMNFEDFVNYAKFQLCATSKKLMNDPIWNEYTSEEILVEYYALLYHNSKEQAEIFMRKINGVTESDYDWIMEQDEKQEAQLGEEEDNISFNPDEIGE